MHNLDRALFEVGEQEMESEQEDFLGILGSLLGGRAGETGPLGEAEELEAAATLLEVRDEAELEQFLGNLFKRAVGVASDFAKSPTGKALGGIVKKAAKSALPVVGKGVGGWLKPSWAGPGERVGKAAGDLLGLELEGLSGEDREFETARALVRFADDATRKAAGAPAGAPPAAVARQAALAAARTHAPGLVNALGAGAPGAGGEPAAAGSRSGRWHRQGDAIVIYNV